MPILLQKRRVSVSSDTCRYEQIFCTSSSTAFFQCLVLNCSFHTSLCFQYYVGQYSDLFVSERSAGSANSVRLWQNTEVFPNIFSGSWAFQCCSEENNTSFCSIYPGSGWNKKIAVTAINFFCSGGFCRFKEAHSRPGAAAAGPEGLEPHLGAATLRAPTDHRGCVTTSCPFQLVWRAHTYPETPPEKGQ